MLTKDEPDPEKVKPAATDQMQPEQTTHAAEEEVQYAQPKPEEHTPPATFDLLEPEANGMGGADVLPHLAMPVPNLVGRAHPRFKDAP